MTSPGIEIRWGSYDNYNDGSFKITDTEQREALRPKLQYAIDMAVDGLVDFGVELTDRKYLDVYRVKPYFGMAASTTTSKTMQLYLRPHQLGGHLDTGMVAHAVLHEELHAIRQETIPVKSIDELAATEGIAYVADYLFKQKVPYHWRYKQAPVLERIMSLPRRDISRQRKDLAKAQGTGIYSPEGERWLRLQRNGAIGRLWPVEIVGINTVYRQVRAGREISELLHLPAAEVLGL